MSHLFALRGLPLLLLFTMPTGMAAAQPAAGIIQGRVASAATGEPLPGAIVRALAGESAAQTDEEGRFTLRGVSVGIRSIEVRRIGFAPRVVADIAVNTARPAEVTVQLSPVVTTLETVTVRPSYFPPLPPRDAPVSTQVLGAEEVRRAPGVQEDVVRAISVLPGVGLTSPSRNDIVVRGGAPFENLFVVDDIEVPNINHFGSQGSTGGPLSLINIDFVQEASLSAGGFGARYGDRTSSVTSISLREGNRERVAGTFNFSATGYGPFAEGPLGERGSFIVGARRSYLDLLFKVLGQSFIPAYTDLTVKVTTRPTSRDQLSFLAVGAIDQVTFDNDSDSARVENSRILGSAQDQYFSGLTWRRTLQQGVLSTTLGRTWTRFDSEQRDSLLATVFRARTTEGETSLRTELTRSFGDAIVLDVGNTVKFASALDYDITIPGFLRRDAEGTPRPLRTDTRLTAWRNATYAQATIPIGSVLRATLGARADWWGFIDDGTRVAPRASLTWAPREGTAVTLAGGRYWQAPQAIWLMGDPGNARSLTPIRADQAVLGLSRTLRQDLKVQLEGYVKRYADYPARPWRPAAVLAPAGFEDAATDIPFGLEPLVSTGTGHVEGAELLVQKKLSEIPVYGLASVSWNRSWFSGTSGREVRGSFDTPLLANVLFGWRPSPRWEYSGRVRTASGRPVTPFVTEGPDAGTLDFARYNAAGRYPLFFALDARVDRRFQLGRTQLTSYLDVQNLTGRTNVSQYQWNPRTRRPEANGGITVFPTIGVRWEF